jgi:hypothetical protein
VHYKTVCPADLVANAEALTQLYGVKQEFLDFIRPKSGDLKQYQVRCAHNHTCATV